MGNWWEVAVPDPERPTLVRAVAYYRHSAQDRQENSIPAQQDQVRQWAREHGVEIIREFCDAGKSGLNSEGRPAFTETMDEWIKKRADFEYVLCLDVSRWGRLQDIDLSAQFSAICKKHKTQVIYTTIGKPKENDPLYPVYVQFERFRAAQYSRELSDKVWRGCVKVAEQGYWAGGSPPYGLRRLLLDEKREWLSVLQPGQRKGIQNQRVTLVEGPPEEVAVIRRIFEQFVEQGHSEYRIAEELNRDGIVSPSGHRWGAGAVLHRLRNEKYAGTMVYNQTSGKLKTPKHDNPPELWVRARGGLPGGQPWTRQLVLQQLRRLCATGYVLGSHLNRSRNPALHGAALLHFGSWRAALTAAGINLANVSRRRPKHLDRTLMIHWLQQRRAAGQSLSWTAVCPENRGYALSIRRVVRSRREAIAAAEGGETLWVVNPTVPSSIRVASEKQTPKGLELDKSLRSNGLRIEKKRALLRRGFLSGRTFLIALLSYNRSSLCRLELEDTVGGCRDLTRFQLFALKVGAEITKHSRRLLMHIAESAQPLWSREYGNGRCLKATGTKLHGGAVSSHRPSMLI